ncbi:MAG: reverse transcriptase domain-containing protein, partial [Cyanobacteriota bacterium]
MYDTSSTDPTESFQKTTKEIAEYVAKTYDRAGEYRLGLVNMELEELVEPPEPKDDSSSIAMKKWERQCKEYDRKLEARQENQERVFALIMGQCTPAMIDRVTGEATWSSINNNSDVIGLLKLIQSNSTIKNAQTEESHAVLDALTAFTNFRQMRLSNSDYLQAFKDRVEHLERVFGPIGHDKPRVKAYLERAHTAEKYSVSEITEAQAACREALLATAFVFGADKKRYGELHTQLLNNHTLHKTGYPKTLTEAFDVLNKWKTPAGDRRVQQGATFLQQGSNEEDSSRTQMSGRGTGGGRGRGRPGRGSGGQGREQHQSPTNTANTTENHSSNDSNNSTPYTDCPQIGITLHQHPSQTIPRTWIILDTASTVDMFLPDMLTNIHQCDDELQIVSTGGTTNLNEKGTLPGYPQEVWCNRYGLANILSFKNVQQHFNVTYDNTNGDSFVVHLNNGKTLIFNSSPTGLYHLDTTQYPQGMFCLITTTNDKLADYTPRGVAQAKLARRVHNIIMRPSTRQFIEVVTHNHIRNCPVERKHIQAAEDIYGPNIGSLKGKTTRKTPAHVPCTTDPVPPEILQRHGSPILCLDVLFINKIAFLTTLTRDLRIGTIEELPNRQIGTIGQKLKNIVKKYEHRGFKISTILADNEFEPLSSTIPELNFEICGADDHIPDIERYVRTIKDSVRSQYNDLPFQYIPRAMLVHMVRNAVFWWNALPHENSVIGHYSPRYILEGRHIDYNRHVRIPFGSYAQVHEPHDNSMIPRTIGAICLGPTGNSIGTHFFLSLSTGSTLTRTSFTELPMPDDVIQRVSAMGKQQGMPRTLTFANHLGHELADLPGEVDDDHDSNYDYQSEDDVSLDYSDATDSMGQPRDPGYPTGVSDIIADEDINSYANSDTADINDDIREHEFYQDDDEDTNPDETNYHMDDQNGIDNNNQHADNINNHDNNADLPNPNQHDNPNHISNYTDRYTDNTRVVPGNTGVGAVMQEGNDDNNDTDEQDASNQLRRSQRRPKPKMNHDFLTGTEYDKAFLFLTAQMTAKKGLQYFGQRGADAILAEMKQVHYRNVIRPRMSKDLTKEQKKQALRYLMFLKEKRCGRIKGRGCADGRKQRLWKTREETSSPTVRTESVFLSAVIDACEEREVVTLDVPGAFMQADIDEFVLVKFESELAQLLEQVEPALYSPYKTIENGKEVIYVQLQKALYGTLQAALLFWKELSTFLVQELGFTLNPYDNCVANKSINGKQCTILWHVDDLKISHVSREVLEDIVRKLEKRFGKEDPLTITWGKEHDYLGMNFNFSTKGEVRITMFDFIDRMLEEAPEDMGGTASTPAGNKLFQVNRNATKLDGKTADMFHTFVAKLLYLCKRTRPDIHTAVTFLTTRVTSPDVDDYAKLRRCIQYLRGTRDLPLTLGGSSPYVVKWWVDASFAVHPDMKSHTGAVMTLGEGGLCAMSTKQKINTKSSTEAELVGVDDAMPN